jgi:hypothetical protein
MSTAKPDVQLYLSDARGVYIPRDFANDTKPECISGIESDTLDILKAGPDHEQYWDAWQEVLDGATLTDPVTGVAYTVYQDGDCWLIPKGMQWDDAKEFYTWPAEETEDEAGEG